MKEKRNPKMASQVSEEAYGMDSRPAEGDPSEYMLSMLSPEARKRYDEAVAKRAPKAAA